MLIHKYLQNNRSYCQCSHVSD